ncbi:MAG: 3-hydroxy-5-phosphonooxypentane-2,4-dione thiolase [Actinobacteria bacterium]|nr:3-hydroxy-5-phosphonooxypentane-2,4-dione thiolase [Actinomycetota bacterium]
MDWGKKNRLAQVIKSDGHCFFLPVDHGYFLGPTHGLEKPYETVKDIQQYCDAIFATRGVIRSALPPDNCLPVVLRISGGTSILCKDLSNEEITTSIDDIIRINASAVGVSVFIGSDYEKQTLLNLAKTVNECEKYGIPVMAVTAVGKELEKRDSRYLSLACRICAELGATVVKTYWCEDFEKVVETCPAPVMMAGGPKCETAKEVFEFVYDGMQRGSIGINLGRNVWQSPHPAAVAKALRAIIHEKADVNKAVEIFEKNK